MIMTPTPVDTIVCSVCAMPWAQHRDSAQARLTLDRWDDDPWSDDDADTAPLATDADVTLEDCVRALAKRFTGPPGPIGAQGAMGPQGPTGPSAPR